MKKLIAVVVASMFATAAFAQTGATPPEQPPAGSAGKMTKQPKTDMPMPPKTDAAPAPMTKSERKAARKAKREAKVGAKPIN